MQQFRVLKVQINVYARKMVKLHHIVNNIELNIVFFSLLLHTFWEGLHSYFYIFPDGFAAYPRFCWYCVGGDVLIALGSFFIVSLIFRSRKWILNPTKLQTTLFILAGTLYTIGSEYVHVNLAGTWQYSNLMPIIPLINVGLTPVLQWIVIPLIVIFIIKRQLSKK